MLQRDGKHDRGSNIRGGETGQEVVVLRHPRARTIPHEFAPPINYHLLY